MEVNADSGGPTARFGRSEGQDWRAPYRDTVLFHLDNLI
jgi:hypothetical protein